MHLSAVGTISIIIVTLLWAVGSDSLPNVSAADAQPYGQEAFANNAAVRLIVSPAPELDKPMQSVPIMTNGTEYTFNFTFIQPDQAKPQTFVQHARYNVIILLNNTEVLSAAAVAHAANLMITPSDTTLTTSNGNATAIHYKFATPGGATVRIIIYDFNSTALTPPVNFDFIYRVVDSRTIPEFPLDASSFPATTLLLLAIPVGILLNSYLQRRRGQRPEF